MATSISTLCGKISSLFFADPLFAEMDGGKVKWGDLLCAADPLP